MKEPISILLNQFQVRKSYQEKSQFIQWMESQCNALGYEMTSNQSGNAEM